MYNSFIALRPGEAAGDPELGGWRPLPKELFQKEVILPLNNPVISLEQAIQLINFKVNYLRLLRAIKKVNIDLLHTQNIFNREVMRCA